MPAWKWEGINKAGNRASGKIDALDEREARNLLRGQGIKVRRILAPSLLEIDLSEWMMEKGLASPFGAADLTVFTKQLATMIDAGVPIIQSLEILYKTQKQPMLKRAIKYIAREVGEGQTIAEAMRKQKGFDDLYCNLVKAGEAGGILDTILNKLAEHMEKQERTKKQIKSAMTYPAIVTLVGIGVIWGMMVFVVPQFVDMLKDTGQEPPAITTFVVNTSAFLGKYSPMMVPAFIIIIFAFKSYIKSGTGKKLFDRYMLKMPIFGNVILKGNLSSFSRTLATLISSGVSLIDSLEICEKTVDNGFIAKDITKARIKIAQGKTLVETLGNIDYFPDMVAQMIGVGEQTGAIDEMLTKVSHLFEEEVNYLVQGMTKMVEPIILVVLGGIIAVILVAMYLPVFMSAGGA